ncbi:TIGR04066 family peptide maturation system protein [Ruminiclostridium cellobioparum]|uniref:Peptide maturation system protein, TIGR04066 family n=1 Tax=Ruminiclostridium cellobioparum subsp. termitidis CT1112 TaxID=1195236 RepID=S0FMP0_RUMCE|nr:TIGR04066 family peptide maturation system protein [Ruminiclostridium cellobioparum]EMS71616.1 peptide maturation system protein, TIGR04066 family [Ruminiclostridium cellobioparum subsp. termitidis CT1112]
MNEKRTLVYPYDVEFTPILRHPEMLPDYNIVALVSPQSWGFNGRDASAADGGDKLGINVSNDFEGLLPCCDTVMFSESDHKLDFEGNILPKVVIAAEQGKDLAFLSDLEDENIEALEEICLKYKVKLKFFSNMGDRFFNRDSDYYKLQKINTPVVFVTGVHEKTHKFEIQLSLRAAFINAGYRVSQVGTRNYCEMLGFHSFPQIMYNSCWSERTKILAFNHYIKDMENNEKPDIIIIGIPGGVMRLSESFAGRFGITAFEISQAVSADAVVLSTFYEEYLPEYFNNLFTSMKYKLDFDITCFNLANVKFDWDVVRETGSESYLLMDSSFIDKKKAGYKTLNTPVFNVLNKEDGTNIANCLIDTLSYYGEVDLV